MQVTETLNEGLKREIKIVVPAEDLAAQLNDKINETKGKIRLNGFRPGKVPAAHLRQTYGKSFMAEIINDILSKTPGKILAERNERAAQQPDIDMSDDEQAAEKVLAGQEDLRFTVKYEVLPHIELKDVADIAVTREIVTVSDAQVAEQLERVLESTRTFSETKDEAADGDRLTIDYVGKIDGVPFDGGADNDAQLIIGSKQFIPGFEEQLVGLRGGEDKNITITFPEDYNARHLAGKEAIFEIKVKEVAKPNPLQIDDEAAKKLGVESLDKLRQLLREQIESQYGNFTRQKVKRQILDALDKDYDFETPQRLVDVEFNNIWSQINAELKQNGQTFEDEGTTEDEARLEYKKLAERRVRLGLVLSELGNKAGVQVTEDELQRALYDQVRQYPGQEKEIMEFFRRTPDAVANLRAPIFEEKVVDYLLERVKVTNKEVTPEQLTSVEDDSLKIKKSAKAKTKTTKKESATTVKKSDDIKKTVPKKASVKKSDKSE